MPRRSEVTRKGEIEELQREVARPTLIHAVSRLLMHVPRTTSGSCPCCGNAYAKVDDVRPDLEVLIDTRRGRRWRRDQAPDVGLFDELAAEADLRVDMPLRCTPETIDLVLSDAWTTLAQGASRSGKTQTGCVWFGRQWMLRGGPGSLAAILGPQLKQAHIILKKLVQGTDGVPPIFDPRLVESYPKTIRDADQALRIVDGTVMLLQHASGDGGHLAGESWDWYQWTEGAVVDDPKVFGQVRGRVVTGGGAGYMDAVPEPSHWLKRGVIDPAREEEEAIADGNGPANRREYLVRQLPVDKNPWNEPGSGEKFRKALEKVDPRLAARYGDGDWVGERNKTFAEYFNAAKHTFELETWTVEPLGFVDITAQAGLAHFRRPHDWIVALDVNADPHTALIGKIGIRAPYIEHNPMAWQNPDLWWGIFFDVLQVWGADSDEAAKVLATVHNKRFSGAGVIMDGSSCQKKHNAGGIRNSSKGFVPKKVYELRGFEVRAPDRSKNGHPSNPRRFDSAIKVRRLMREDRLLFNRLRCRKLIEAIRDQESEPDGITPMRASNTWADRHIVSCTDVLRYWTWPYFPVGEGDKAPPKARQHA